MALATVQTQLTFNRESADFGETLHVWFAEALELLGGEVAASLRQDPLPEDALRRWRASRPVGAPGTPWGLQRVIRRHARGTRTAYDLFSNAAWDKFLRRFDERVVRAELWLGNLDTSGYPGGGFRVIAEASEKHPEWVYLHVFNAHTWFANDENQRRLLAIVRSTADVCNPSFGQVEHRHDGHATPLETVLRLDPDSMLPKSREQLRGYSWLTVCSQQVGDALGGATALAESKAFVEVAQLTNGGYWLLASPTYQQYTMDSAEAVFDILAPRLPPGQPRGLPQRPGAPRPLMLVNRDAAKARHQRS